MHALLGLFLTFFKLGAFTFGGGYAMISLIENEVVTKKGWLTREEMFDIITIAESTPGPLAVNMATFVGTKLKGFLGALIATLGLVIPPFVIIICITLVLNEFKEITVIAYALKGIQAGVVVLIFNAFLKFFKGMDKSIMSYIFLGVSFIVALFTDFPVVLIILIGAVAGVTITLISAHIAKKKTAAVSRDENGNISENATSDTLAGGIANESDNIDTSNCASDGLNSDDDTSDVERENHIENHDENDENITHNVDDITNSDVLAQNEPLDDTQNDKIDSICEDVSIENNDTYTIVSENKDEEDDKQS